MTILCESDEAVVSAIAASLAGESEVRAVPDLASAALSVEADAAEQVIVIGRDAPLDDIVEFTRNLLVQRPDVAVILLRHGYQPDVAAAAYQAGVVEIVPTDNAAAVVAAFRRARAARSAHQATIQQGVPVPPVADEQPPSVDSAVSIDDEPAIWEQADDWADAAVDQPAAAVDASPQPGKLITVFSPKGGSGKTTTSTNLAVALNQLGHTVCLVDLDLEFGDVAISLRLAPARTLLDAVTTEFAGDDEEAIKLLITPYRPGLDCVLAPIEPGEAEKIPAQVVSDILALLRLHYGYVVIDSPAQLSENVLAALDLSDHHVLVTNPEIPALKNLRLALDMFDLLGYDRAKRSIVFNRADTAAGLTAAEVEEALRSPIAAHVPFSRDVPASINRGEPIVSAKRDHEVSKAFREFANRTLVAQPASGPGRPAKRSRFFRRKAR